MSTQIYFENLKKEIEKVEADKILEIKVNGEKY